MPRRRTPPADLTIETVPVTKLRPDPKNARVHGERNLDAIEASLRQFGLRKPLVVDRRYTVVAGNGTLEVIRERLGWEQVAVSVFPGTASEARAYAIADNRTGELAEWDPAALLDALQTFDPALLDAAGFQPEDVDDLLAVAGGLPPALTDPDDAPDVGMRRSPLTARGDVWELGGHRLVIGDATDPAAYEALLGGEVADCVWTDPPYGVDYVGKTREKLTIQNDGRSGLEALLAGAFEAMTKAVRAGAPFYVAHADTERLTFETTIRDAGWSVRQSLIWVKNTMVLGRSDYHYRHEPILYGFAPGGSGRLGRGGAQWFGDNSQVTTFFADKPSRSEAHPTMKPVGLIRAMLDNSCPAGGTVLDAFGGSGSTLIAAHQAGLAARMVELDPVYGDVICRRWQEHTGVIPVLERTGEERDFVTG